MQRLKKAHCFLMEIFLLKFLLPVLMNRLKLHRQYVKNIGTNVVVTFNDGTEKEGKLLEVTETIL